MLASLTTFQQEQVRTQVASYQASLNVQPLKEEQRSVAVFQFWKTMVTYLYNNTGGRGVLVGQTVVKKAGPPPPPPTAPRKVAASPPPPPSKPHPLAMSMPAYSNPPFRISQPVPNVAVASYSTTRKSVSAAEVIDLDAVPPKRPRTAVSNPVNKRVSAPLFTEDFVPLTSKPHVGKVKKVSSVQPRVTKSEGSIHAHPRLNHEEISKRSERAEKFKEHLMIPSFTSSAEATADSVNVQYEFGNDEDDIFEKTEQFSVVGTCTKLEKRYLRLTSAPDPAQVRPEPVLEKWLGELRRMWSSKEKEWKYIEDQMRAIRQDLTVQNIRGALTSKVYELNSRWALESGDLGQFNQCQTQLKQLHWAGSIQDASVDVKAEFLSYRLLYYYFQNLRVDEQMFLDQLMGLDEYRHHPYVVFALEVRTAATTNNFSKYFRLSRCASDESGGKCKGRPASHVKFLLSAFEAKQRISALIVLTKAFVTQIAVEWLSGILGFSSSESCVEFLTDHGGILKNESSLDPKSSFPVFASSPLLVSSKLKLMG